MLNLRHGIYLIIFFMPLYLWKFSIFGIPTTVLEMMIYILFLIWILNKIEILKYFHTLGYGSICLGKVKKNNFYLRLFYPALAEGFGGFNRLCKNNLTLSIGITLLFFGLIISTAFSSDIRTSLGMLKGWFVSPFLFFIVFINIIKKREHIFWSLKSWLASGVVVSLIGIFYLLSGDITFDGRLHAFFLSPNHLAMYISPAFLILLFFLLSKLSFPRRRESIATMNNGFGVIYNIKKIFNIKYLRPRRTSLGLAISIIIIAIPLYFTYSYGAFLGTFVGIIWLFYKMYNCHSDRSERSMSKRSGGICKRNLSFYISSLRHINKKSFLKILILIIFISITVIKFNQITNSENRSSFHSRLMIWNTAGEIIKDNPLFGIGPGTFQETYLSYAGKFSEPYLEWAVPQPHNIFLAFYLQTGLIGFVGFILILIWFFGRRNEALPRSYNIINTLMIYILIHGLVDTTYWKNDLSLIFWLLVGLAVVNNMDSCKIKPKK